MPPSGLLTEDERADLAAITAELERRQEQAAVHPSLAEFVSHCLILRKETGALIPFELWPEQTRALSELQEHENVVAVKGRQVGITWLVLALMAYEGTFWGHRAFPIARQSEEYAQDAVRRLLILWGYDPASDLPELKVLPESTMPPEWRPRIITKNVKELRAANGSSWTAHTASRSLGRGLSGYRGLADEFAFWPWPGAQRKAMEAGCSRLDIVSTGNGEGDDFHLTWNIATEGKGRYHPLFISADADPRRDLEWFRQNVEEDADPDSAAREYARSPEDAFRAPEGAYFKRFERAVHVRSLVIVPNWPTYRAVDFGYRHPACLWLQESPAGQACIVAEYLPGDATTEEFAAGIIAIESGFGFVTPPACTYCDPAGKAANMQTAESEFEVFARAGLRPTGQPSGIRDGCVRVMNALAHPELPLLVSDACPEVVSALAQVKPHKTRPEVYDFDHETYSHPLDALRYYFIGRGTKRAAFTAPKPDLPMAMQRVF